MHVGKILQVQDYDSMVMFEAASQKKVWWFANDVLTRVTFLQDVF